MSLDSRVRQHVQHLAGQASNGIPAHAQESVVWRAEAVRRRRRRLTYVTLVAAAVVVVGALGLGAANVQLLGLGKHPVVSSPSPSPSPLSLSQRYRSAQHYEISYPSGWTVTPATTPWVYGRAETWKTDDVLRAGDGSGWRITSQAIPAGMTGTQWLREWAKPSPNAPSNTLVCFPELTQYRPTVIDGHQAWVHGGMSPCNFTEAVVIVGHRAYKFTAQPALDHWVVWVYNSTTFDQMLASVHFTG